MPGRWWAHGLPNGDHRHASWDIPVQGQELTALVAADDNGNPRMCYVYSQAPDRLVVARL
eukprot:752300-Hanusia_phi.AAC.5